MDDAAVTYERTVPRWSELSNVAAKAPALNRQFDENQRAYLILRASTDGQRVARRLAEDPDEIVRGRAAAHILDWDPELAREILVALRSAAGTVGIAAKYTLIEFDKSKKLNDWDPDRRRSG